jgi:hypothetical protein
VLGFNDDCDAARFSTKIVTGSRLQNQMASFLSIKVPRLLLSFSVSVWLAGGCLFGCSNKAVGAELESEVPAVVAGESCHAAHSHDTQEPKKQQVAKSSKQKSTLPSLAPAPRGMMKDCPLVANSTAVASKSSGHLPDPGRAPVAPLQFVENKTEPSSPDSLVPFLPNRGPIYLRCCVFLI